MRYVRAIVVCLLLLAAATGVLALQKESVEAGNPADKGAQTTEKSGKLLAPLIKPLPSFDEMVPGKKAA